MMKNAISASFTTDPYHGYNVKYSPFRKNLLACAASENYGIVGKGRLFILEIDNNKGPVVITTRDWFEGLYDVTWSEVSPQLVVTSCCDGSVQIWDYAAVQSPVSIYKIHQKEVYSVEWSPQNTYNCILSASWDKSVKVWNPFAGKEESSFEEHTDQVYEACWSPQRPGMFASVSADQTLKLWDIRSVTSTGTFEHECEVLCCDWSKYSPDLIATGTTLGKIIEWDVRKTDVPLFILSGHEYAIRQLKYSPHDRSALASVSYDYTTRFWNWNIPHALEIHKQHTEFVYGLDFNPLRPGQVCDCGWDTMIQVYTDLTT